ncbi:MAG: hypothetical protein AB7S55_09195 [Thiomonas sp.]|jgi:hypothetical protein
MASSEAVALAAHLHVLLRRKTGRVTDTEWMAQNAEYAREVLRIARAEGDADLAQWADRFEAVMFPASTAATVTAATAQASPSPAMPVSASAYVGRLR